MNHASKTKWQIRAAVFAIFLLGFVAGALTLNAYHTRRWLASQAARDDRFELMLNRLQLTTDQRTRVEKILGDMREQIIAVRKEAMPKIGEIRRQTDERLRQVLTPAQWTQFQQMKGELRGRWRRGGHRDGVDKQPPEERR